MVTDLVPLGPALAALALGDDAVFLEELLGRLGEGLFRLEQSSALLAAQGQVPVFGELLGQGQAVLLATYAMFLAIEER
jgi:hypothetical protein